ncbi:hypothetical protein RSOLAG1IB_04766 [Rhizoctonia solani AG-1 IB]|uniref:Uncharacterized protein n=1 Tax=Thanatephorus cucumeris (strain AG1-IB / isolate 7/3/14) TaxID=1108050 RepID=A0A0B7FWE9_THACB|nr:hypothetical protein RSOLAG1IB_04766 [Rhizoctonia solani AG-1 IB]
MLAGILVWVAAAVALPLDGGVVCAIEACSSPGGSRKPYMSIRRLVERQDESSSSSSASRPALGVILGGVFGALGGLAIAGVIFYAWWSVRRMRSKHGNPEVGGSSSFGPSSSTSRGSSSKAARKKRPNKGGPKWQDPWLAPPPKSPRTPTAMQFNTAIPVNVAKVPNPQDDQASESSSVPLKVIYPKDDGNDR